MIPVALPSVEALLLLAFFLITTLVWGVWSLWLLVRYMGGRWKRPMILPYGLVAAVALFTLFRFGEFYLEMSAYDRREQYVISPNFRNPHVWAG